MNRQLDNGYKPKYQWGSLLIAIVTGLGFLWTISNYIQDMSGEVKLLKAQHVLEREEIIRLRDDLAKLRGEVYQYLYGPSKGDPAAH